MNLVRLKKGRREVGGTKGRTPWVLFPAGGGPRTPYVWLPTGPAGPSRLVAARRPRPRPLSHCTEEKGGQKNKDMWMYVLWLGNFLDSIEEMFPSHLWKCFLTVLSKLQLRVMNLGSQNKDRVRILWNVRGRQRDGHHRYPSNSFFSVGDLFLPAFFTVLLSWSW